MDGQIPVIVGIGQVSNKDDDRVVHPLELIEQAVHQAIQDAQAPLARHIGAVYASPLSVFDSSNAAELVAARLGLPDGLRRVHPGYSGTGPLKLIDEACRAIADGRLDAALIVGGVADASVRRAQARGHAPPAPPAMPLSLGSASEYQDRQPVSPVPAGLASLEGQAGAASPASIFALVESRIAAVAQHQPARHREFLGQFLAPLTHVAARNSDLAWFPRIRSASEISTVSADNRWIAEPYTKLMCSFPTVDLAAGVIITSTGLADRVGVPSTARVHPWGIASGREPGTPAQRREMHRSAALESAVERVLHSAGIDTAMISTFDFYSCFPAAVQLAAAAFGLAPADSRDLSATGGMPYFGGPGAHYGLHGVAAIADRCRARPGSIGAAVGLGGMIEHFAVGLFSTEVPSKPYASDGGEDVTRRLEGQAVPVGAGWQGEGIVHAMTVLHDRTGPVAVPIIADLPDGSRVGASAEDPQLATQVSGSTFVGRTVRLSMRDGQQRYEPT